MLSPNVASKLLSYQIEHVVGIKYSIGKYGRALDASDTGTGKTFTSIAVAMAAGLKPFVVCPKSVITSWLNALKHFGSECYGISNYELLQNCKMYSTAGEKINCPYLTRVLKEKDKKEADIKTVIKNIKDERKDVNGQKGSAAKKKIKYTFNWKNLPNDVLIIFDESHRCKNRKTGNSLLLASCARTNAKILMMSATVCDKPENFAITGYVLNLYEDPKKIEIWIKEVGNGFDNPMSGVHDIIFPEYASRMRIRDLKGMFPDNQIVANCYDMETAEEIQKKYKVIEQTLLQIKEEKLPLQSYLALLIKMRQEIEMLKVPTFIKMTEEYVEEGAAVAIFVNFTRTLTILAEQLKTTCVIHGQQTMEERNKAINDFNSDKSHIIICNIRSGGVGVSLHDTHGNFPRISLISPSWSAQDIVQALGRVHRANGKTPVRQRIIFCKDTVEEDICQNIKEKINNIAMLNDKDTNSYQYEGLIDAEELIDTKGELSDFEKTFQRLQVLQLKKDRLKQELDEVESEINDLQQILMYCD